MTTRITDSAFYRHLWGTDEARAVLGEEGRLAGWLEVITALARVQAEAGLIPGLLGSPAWQEMTVKAGA